MKNDYKSLKDGHSVIVNLSKDGSHWTSIKRDGNNILYFDSFGVSPFQKVWNVDKNKDVYYNTTQVQDIKSSSCGYFCVHFIQNVDTLEDFEQYVYDWNLTDQYENEKKIEQFIKTLK